MSRRLTAFAAGLPTAGSIATAPPAAASPPPQAPAAPATLTNLAHLDFLTATVTPPPQPGHTTYQLASEPSVGVLWVYANYLAPGSYQVTGGGTYDPANNTYGQGAYDADDISRAAVVYLRHWMQFGDQHSRDKAYQLLRGLTYLQTAFRTQRRQRRAMDAARRQPQPHAHPRRLAESVRLGCLVLAGPHHLGAR